MQSVAVYKLKDRMLVHPWQRTTMGLAMASEPYVSLPLDADAKTLGSSVLSALALSGQTVPHPTSWKGSTTPRLEAAGVGSERAFQLNASSVTVDRAAEFVRIEPSHNGGTEGNTKGFAPLPDLSASIPSKSSAEEIGAAVRTCFARCT